MIHRTYSCDLCGEESPLPELAGIYPGAAGIELRTDVARHEQHICRKCVRAIRESKGWMEDAS